MVSIGDSITWRPSKPQAYPALIGPSRGFRAVVNSAIDGETSLEMLARFDQDVLAYGPRAVSLMCGTNDCAAPHNTPLVDYEAAIREMIARAQGVGARFTLCTPPVARGAAWAALPDYVDVIRAIAGDTPDVVLFDVYARFETYSEGTLDLLYVDDVHLNATGQQWIADFANEPGQALAFTGGV